MEFPEPCLSFLIMGISKLLDAAVGAPMGYKAMLPTRWLASHSTHQSTQQTQAIQQA